VSRDRPVTPAEAAPPGEPSAKAAFKHAAFISYAHEDSDTARWLHRYLERHWIPGKRRRDLYLDRSNLEAGPLSASIEQALRESKFLIVCASPDAARSRWVNDEVKLFLQSSSPDHILACHVGARDGDCDDSYLPPDIRGLYAPDLRGNPLAARGDVRRRYEDEAAGLLARIVGLTKKELIDRTRRTWRAITIVTAALIAAGIVGITAREVWLRTPPGMYSVAVRRLLAAARTNRVDDLTLVETSAARGQTRGASDVERFAVIFSDSQFRSLARAAGYASTRPPDCERAQRALTTVDTISRKLWPFALLETHRACGAPDALALAPDSSPQVLGWVEVLSRTGHVNEARAAASTLNSVDDVIRSRVALTVAGDTAATIDESQLEQWTAERTTLDERLADLASLIGRLEAGGEINSPLAAMLVRAAVPVANSTDLTQINNVDHLHRIAAAAAAIGMQRESRSLLDRPGVAKELATSYAPRPEAWAWRGLALHRLGDVHGGSLAFETADSLSSAEWPADRTWAEIGDMMLAAALAGDWLRVFRACEIPNNEHARMSNRAKAIVLYRRFYSSRPAKAPR
jgi:hypothetical protein